MAKMQNLPTVHPGPASDVRGKKGINQSEMKYWIECFEKDTGTFACMERTYLSNILEARLWCAIPFDL